MKTEKKLEEKQMDETEQNPEPTREEMMAEIAKMQMQLQFEREKRGLDVGQAIYEWLVNSNAPALLRNSQNSFCKASVDEFNGKWNAVQQAVQEVSVD